MSRIKQVVTCPVDQVEMVAQGDQYRIQSHKMGVTEKPKAKVPDSNSILLPVLPHQQTRVKDSGVLCKSSHSARTLAAAG